MKGMSINCEANIYCFKQAGRTRKNWYFRVRETFEKYNSGEFLVLNNVLNKNVWWKS
jgi:hypothetical protein